MVVVGAIEFCIGLVTGSRPNFISISSSDLWPGRGMAPLARLTKAASRISFIFIINKLLLLPSNVSNIYHLSSYVLRAVL